MLKLLDLLSAVALLVWGTHIVRTGILRVYGADLRRILSRSVEKRPLAFAAGIGVTALVQSSNATALLATSFVAQGLMALAPALAIMLGADVGTALMARVLTLDLSWLSPLLIFFGVIFFLSRKQTRLGQLGRVFIGLGLIILALQLIVAAAEPMTQAKGVKVLFSSLTGDIMLDALTGALFAMISYSSLAAVLLTATLAASKVISLKVALCLVVGANLGSGILAMLSATAQNAAGRRVALGSLLFKVAGCLLVLPLVGPLADWMDHWQFSTAELVIAFHVLYNAARCLACLPLTNAMASFCTRVMPDRALPDDVARPRHLDPAALDTPSLALANAVRETLRMGDTVEQMLNNLMQIIRGGDPLLGKDIRKLDDDVDALYTAIKLYLGQGCRARTCPNATAGAGRRSSSWRSTWSRPATSSSTCSPPCRTRRPRAAARSPTPAWKRSAPCTSSWSPTCAWVSQCSSTATSTAPSACAGPSSASACRNGATPMPMSTACTSRWYRASRPARCTWT